jgi:hypothetical protein
MLTVYRNRDEPIGYKLSYIAFDGAGSPVENSTSTTSTVDILTNPDLSQCPENCVRPVSVAWDSEGRLFMTSDATGEIWLVEREDGGSANDASPGAGLPSGTTGGTQPTGSEGAPEESNSPGAASVNVPSLTVGQFAAVWAAILAVVV